MAAQPEATQEVFPVLIVGGDPVGLAMAVELGWRGIRCLLVDHGDGTVDHPKTKGVNMRTMEFCRRWGIHDAVREQGYPRDRPHDHIYFTTLAGHLIYRHSQPPLEEVSPPSGALEPFQRCPQTVLDPLLMARARSFPSVTLRHRTRCESISQDGEGVDARIMDLSTGKATIVRARFVVACEGARWLA